MIIFVYTFALVFIALAFILGLGSIITGIGAEPPAEPEGAATAAMCTTRLLGNNTGTYTICDEDFVIEQDLVFTYDSLNL